MIRAGLIGAALAVAVSAHAQAQDAAAGAKTFVICRACHEIGPGAKILVGPPLNGVVGRKAGTYPGFQYSKANEQSGITWTPEELTKYLADPQKVVPGTKMIFPGLHNPKQVQDVIAYLEQFGPDGQKKSD
ncbi:MAG TPA: cytochrome c family protein [Acetobacteraceae bacterium]|nr:cytochrome c family protein [Acetobacteraceae bacterium]